MKRPCEDKQEQQNRRGWDILLIDEAGRVSGGRETALIKHDGMHFIVAGGVGNAIRLLDTIAVDAVCNCAEIGDPEDAARLLTFVAAKYPGLPVIDAGKDDSRTQGELGQHAFIESVRRYIESRNEHHRREQARARMDAGASLLPRSCPAECTGLSDAGE
ncbi:MAG: hypothetical protein OEW15_02820 [Nitrospirota bacterium]|nr:hypothetical protein [Nitrospirota bacterium]